VEAVRKLGVCVEVISPKPYTPPLLNLPYSFRGLPKKTFENCPVHHPRYIYPYPKKMLYHLTHSVYHIFTKRYVRREVEKPDLVHTHYPYPDGAGVAAIAKEWGVPHITHVRGLIVNRVIWEIPQIRPTVIKTLRMADKVIAVSIDLAKKCVELGVKPEKIRVIRDGVNMGEFRCLDKIQARRTLGLPLDTEIILYVGHLWRIKGVTKLVKAVRPILEKRKDLMLIFVGRGDQEDRIAREAGTLLSLGKIRLVGDKPPEEIPIWMNAADLLVLPSLSEGLPNVVLEAMACETPVLASKAGGIPEVIKEGENGYLIENPESVDEIGEK